MPKPSHAGCRCAALCGGLGAALRLRLDGASIPGTARRRRPGDMERSDAPGLDACAVLGAVVATLRRSAVGDAREPTRCRPTPACKLRRPRCARRARRATWRPPGLLPSLGGSASAQRSQSATAAAATTSRWASMRAGSSMSSAPTAVRSTPARPACRASAASLGDVQVSIAAEVALAYITLRSAQARLAIAERQPGQPAGDAAAHPVAPAGRPRDLARSRAGTRRGRADPRAVAGAADRHRADPSRAGGADRPAACGLGRRSWPQPGPVPQPGPTTWRSASPPKPCASGPTCVPPNTR